MKKAIAGGLAYFIIAMATCSYCSQCRYEGWKDDESFQKPENFKLLLASTFWPVYWSYRGVDAAVTAALKLEVKYDV